MKKALLMLLGLVAYCAVWAAEFPATSTEADPTWYFLKFNAGGNVVAAQGEGEQVKTAVQANTEAQYWRLEGNATDGYTFISKTGLTLYTSTTVRDGMFSASASATDNTRFNISEYSTGYVISPKANSGVTMNQWGGAGVNKEVGLWSSPDANAVLTFVTEAEYKEELSWAPVTSTEANPTWYFLKFNAGGNIVAAQGAGEQVKTASLTGAPAQYWRLEGDATNGYTIISKTGLTLYTSTTARDGMFSADTNPASNTRFTITRNSGGFVISPVANSGVYMNQWGGAGVGKDLGLWNSADANSIITLVLATEYEAELKLASLPLVPMPSKATIGGGTQPISAITSVAYPSSEYAPLAEQYATTLGKISGVNVTASLGTSGAGVVLKIDNTITEKEAYTIKCDGGSIVVSAGNAHGLFNGLQTLRQLFYDARYNHDGEMQLVDIEDKPLLGYRGFMLDIARHFFDKEEVKKILDVMALYKVNRFHWHLTDDQGWRIEIPEYPRLTTVGAIRERSNTKSSSPRFYDDTEYGRGMYYTLDDLREIVEYAKALHIDIMPEIDLPGHMVAAIASYPELFACSATPIEGSSYKVRVDQGVSKDVLNVAKPEVMDFLYCVLGHMAEIFPYEAMHIGGDECPTDAWNNLINASDPQFTAWMAENDLATANDIQPWLVNELGKWLKEKYNKDVVCWNELVDHWKDEYETKPIIMCYSDYGQNSMKKATDRNLRTIYTGCWPFYLDMYQTYGDHQFDEPYTGGYGNNTLQRAYEATPLSNIAGKENLCLGVGANLWTETVNNNLEAEHQFFPRMLALAEVGWLPQGRKNWSSFRQRVQTHFRVFDDMGVNYATYDLDEPTLTPIEEAQKEADRLLAGVRPDAVGHPAAAAVDALREARNTAAEASELTEAITTFKNAPVVLPEAGKTYRIVSASVAWSRDYAGSTLYTSGNSVRFHYTPQTEPEELFTFEPTAEAGSYNIRTRVSNTSLVLGAENSKATMGAAGSTVSVAIARTASTAPVYYDYIPGVLTLSASDTQRLNAYADGYAYAKADAVVGNVGTWRIEEVTDWKAELEGLARKCTRLDILDTQLVRPATALVRSGSVTKEQYEDFLAIYLDAFNSEKIIPICVERDATYTGEVTGRKLRNFTVTTPAGGSKTFTCDESRVYNNLTIQRCIARAGETVAITADYNGKDWMNSYVYIDRDHSWTLETEIADHRPTAASELMSYSFYSENDESDTKGWNSLGAELTTGARNVLTPPVFTLPADLPAGDYILRFKIDWNSIDPAGDTIAANKTFVVNNGAIADVTIRVLSAEDLNGDGNVNITDVTLGVDNLNAPEATITLDGLDKIVNSVLQR